MVQSRLRIEQLSVGTRLESDVFDAAGRLLLARGSRIENGSQIERLVQSGLYSEIAQRGKGDEPLSDDELLVYVESHKDLPRAAWVSIPGLLNEIARRLGGLLEANERPPDFPLDLRSMADGVRKCCALDPDAALSHILLSRHIRYPVRQSLNVAILSAMLLERLKTEDARASAAVAAALTMNLSMIALQDTLYAQHGPPNEEQTLLLHAHPRAGAEELRQRGVLNGIWLKTVEQHHEARDGSGYPDGLKGDAISREAQVVTLADRYCGKVSERAYRPAYAPGAALKELHTKCAAQIDSALIGMLVALLGPYPPGTFVILANGETAIVTGRLLDLKNPVAAALYLNPRMHYEAPRKRLTGSLPQHKIAGVVSREAVTVGIDVDQLWPRTRGAPTTA